jgi:hypothetical protein
MVAQHPRSIPCRWLRCCAREERSSGAITAVYIEAVSCNIGTTYSLDLGERSESSRTCILDLYKPSHDSYPVLTQSTTSRLRNIRGRWLGLVKTRRGLRPHLSLHQQPPAPRLLYGHPPLLHSQTIRRASDFFSPLQYQRYVLLSSLLSSNTPVSAIPTYHQLR